MKNKKAIKAAAVLISISGMIVALGFGCGVGYTPNGAGSSTQLSVAEPTDTTLPGNIDGLVMKAGTVTYGTAIYTTTYNSLLSKLNLDPTVPAQVASSTPEFTAQRESLSDNGKPTAINASFAFAATALSAATCLDRINFERLNPTLKLFFNDVDLTAAPGTQLTDTALKGVINRLARGLYGDNESPAEDAILLADVRASIALDTATGVNITRNAMLYLCTSMAGSTSGISQ